MKLLVYGLISVIFVILFIIYKRISKYRFINLVLYSEDDNYKNMYSITREYYSTFENVTTIYYKWSETIDTDFELIGDVLHIRGSESFIPGILEKTISAMRFVNEHYRYDYLIRSNISTIVNFEKLNAYLSENKMDYGGMRFVVDTIQPKYGINDMKYFGIEYASGISMIFSKRAIEYLLLYNNELDYHIIDDVAIGIFFKNKNINPSFIPETRFWFVPNMKGNEYTFQIGIYEGSYICYRNNNEDRSIDVSQMRFIVDKIIFL